MNPPKFQTERLARWRTISHAESFERTLSNIEQFGWDAMLVKGDPQSRFAYTTGAFDALHVPELIVVGLTLDTAHTALHRAIEAMQAGVDLTAGRHRKIVGEVEVEFRHVNHAWLKHVMYRTNWYYEGAEVPALQLIFPDLEGHFQWEDEFNDYFLQPLLTSHPAKNQPEQDFWALNDPESALFNWKFPDPPHTRVYLSQTVQDKIEPVTYVSHDTSDGAWQFLGASMADGGGPVISCFHHPIDDDRSLEELHDLPLGWYAARERVGDPWQRVQKSAAEND
jgi:hypothetical protein